MPQQQTFAWSARIPAVFALEAKGYRVARSDTGWFEAVGPAGEFCAEDPLSLLGIVATIETQGAAWQPSDAETETFATRFGETTTAANRFQHLYYQLVAEELDHIAELLDPEGTSSLIEQAREYTGYNELGLAFSAIEAHVKRPGSVVPEAVTAQIDILGRFLRPTVGPPLEK